MAPTAPNIHVVIIAHMTPTAAMVSMAPKSFTATNSKSTPLFIAALKKFLPIRPKPLIPTRTVMNMFPPATQCCQYLLFP